MRILGIAGSLRRDSYNHALLREAAERLPAGVEFVEFERLAEIPPYDADLEETETPAAVAELREAMREADAVLVATPEYTPRPRPAKSSAPSAAAFSRPNCRSPKRPTSTATAAST